MFVHFVFAFLGFHAQEFPEKNWDIFVDCTWYAMVRFTLFFSFPHLIEHTISHMIYCCVQVYLYFHLSSHFNR